MRMFFEILGSLGLFLFGMNVLSDGLQKAAGERLQAVLNFMTKNRFMAVFTGFLVTCIIQSSSATTVMVVSFVNAQLLTLVQAIGVIMGANIGTTATGWLVALFGFKFDIAAVAIPAIGIALPFYFSKKSGRRNFGQTLIGFGLLFLGLSLLKNSVPDVGSTPEVLAFLRQFTDLGFLSYLIFVLVGTVLTMIVQSSSAAMAITLTMAYAGWINLEIAAAIILGENIGTTITALLASIGTNVNARRAARAHLAFNLIGVLWMTFVFSQFLGLVEWIIPGELAGPGDIPPRLALFHTLFNLSNTLLCIWFVKPLARFLVWLIPDNKAPEDPQIYELKYISGKLQTTPEFNILNAKIELSKMAEILKVMYAIFVDLLLNPGDKELKEKAEKVQKMEEYTDQMQEKLTAFLIQCSKEELNQASARHVILMMRIVNELERIGDSIYNLIILCQRRAEQKIDLGEEAMEEVIPYVHKVQSFIAFIHQHLNDRLSERQMAEARSLENEIDNTRNTLHKSARARLRVSGNVKSELMIMDMVQHMEHIGDYSINVAEALRKMDAPGNRLTIKRTRSKDRIQPAKSGKGKGKAGREKLPSAS